MLPNMNTQPQSKIYLSVKVLDEVEGGKIQAQKPDEFGYYKVPVAVIGAKSRNQCYYDTQSLLREINSTDSIFNQTLTHGNLYGEFGHPPITSDIPRIETILEDRRSHHIKSLYTGTEYPDGSVLLMAEVKPVMPYGSALEESFKNPYENTAFSLRCLMKASWDKNLNAQMRHVVRLVTFDHVNMQGFLKASKRFTPGTESIHPGMVSLTPEPNEVIRELSVTDFFDNNGSRVGMESLSDRDLMDLFDMNEVTFEKTITGMYMKNTGTLLNTDGRKSSATHQLLLNRKRGF